jgi:hypothetical protein
MSANNIPQGIEKIEEISNHDGLSEINKRLQNGWVLLDIAHKRHQKQMPEYFDELFYVLGKLRGPNY